MVNTWSGAIIYEWIQEMNQYGLINYGPQLDAGVNEGTRVIQGFAFWSLNTSAVLTRR